MDDDDDDDDNDDDDDDTNHSSCSTIQMRSRRKIKTFLFGPNPSLTKFPPVLNKILDKDLLQAVVFQV